MHVLTNHVRVRLKFLLPGFRGPILVQGNLVTLPPPAELPARPKTDYGIPEDAFVLLFLGRMDVWVKGLDLLVGAFSYLPSDRFWLVMAGPDWKGGLAELKQLAEQFGCRDRIVFPGPVYGEKKWSFFRMANMFVSPSRWEAFSIAQAEAMACGLPVVTSTKVNLASGPQIGGCGPDRPPGGRTAGQSHLRAGSGWRAAADAGPPRPRLDGGAL